LLGLILSSIGCDIFVFDTKEVKIRDKYSGIKFNSVFNIPHCQPILSDIDNNRDKIDLLMDTYSSNQYGFGGVKMGENYFSFHFFFLFLN
jgi:hypothetical protein